MKPANTTQAPFQKWNDEDHQMYVKKEKDDAAHAETIHQAMVDQPMDPAYLPKYILQSTTGTPTITECDTNSVKLEYQESLDQLQPGRIFKCQIDQCNQIFLTSENLLRHLTQHRTQCADCMKPFESWQRLLWHAETCKHRLQRLKGKLHQVPAQPKTQPNAKCRLCNKICANPTALQRHQLHLHAQRPASKIWILRR